MVSFSSEDPSERTSILRMEQDPLRELQAAKELQACLVVIKGSPQGHRHFITSDCMIVGRDLTADILLNDQSVSRKHARIFKDGPDIKLTDLGSTNGASINGEKLASGETRILEREDLVKIGVFIMKFLPAGEPEIALLGDLAEAALMDSVTGVFNRVTYIDALEAEFKRAKAIKTDFSMIIMDLDFFKKVNDTHGHDAGDFVLREFADLVRSRCVRRLDTFARYGGEEFVLLLPRSSGADATNLAERIRAMVEAHEFLYETKHIPITVSLGVSQLTPAVDSTQALFKLADSALYQSKRAGRNRTTLAN